MIDQHSYQPEYQKILAIDYGTKRVGVAISHGSLAEPLSILENSDDLVDQLLKLVEEHSVQKIIVGLSENHMAELTKDFVEMLKKKIDIEVEFVDETLSSYEVQQKMRQTGKRLLSQKGPIDHLAAAHFLQVYLDEVHL